MEEYVSHPRAGSFTLIDRRAAKRGFTLIELSIVLVIIGLIVGGILAGGEMIKMAEMRRLMGQIESYNLAVTTFRGKYNSFPGDSPHITSFFPQALNGNGNEKLECYNISNPLQLDAGLNNCTFSGEYAEFWAQLSDAQLINGRYDGGNVAGSGFPKTSRRGGIIAYYNNNPRPFEHRFAVGADRILGGSLSAVGGSSMQGILPRLSYREAGIMDSKWDDGIPRTGTITVFGVTSCGPGCTGFSTPSSYDRTNADQPNQLRMYFKMTSW